MSKALEKLENVIEEQEEKIEELEGTIEYHERCINWMLHRVINEKKESKEFNGYNKLPFPRIEMRINPLDDEWYSIEWLYGIVYKHFDGSVLFVPLSRTTGNGSSYIKMKTGKIELPYRDGLHIRTEMKLLNLKGYVLCNDRIETIDDGDYSQSTFDDAMKKMKRS